MVKEKHTAGEMAREKRSYHLPEIQDRKIRLKSSERKLDQNIEWKAQLSLYFSPEKCLQILAFLLVLFFSCSGVGLTKLNVSFLRTESYTISKSMRCLNYVSGGRFSKSN